MCRLDKLENIPTQKTLKQFDGTIGNERDYHIAVTHVAERDGKCLVNANYILHALQQCLLPYGCCLMRTA